MTVKNELHAIRHEIRVTQAIMAEYMGVPIRTYEDLETGRSSLRPIHLAAARWACLAALAAGVTGTAALPQDVEATIHAAGFSRSE